MANEPADSIAAATTATTFAVLLQAATALKNAAQTEVDTTGATLVREGPLWTETGAAVTTLADSFQSAASELMQGWTSKREAPAFESASAATQKALHDSAAAVDGSDGRGTIQQMCTETVDYMKRSVQAASTAVDQVTAAQQAFAIANPASTSYQSYGGPLGRTVDPVARAAAEAQAVEAARPVVLQVGGLLTTQNTVYSSIGQQILAAGQGLQWVGPNGSLDPGVGSNAGSAGTGASAATAGTGGAPGADGAGGDQAGGAADQAGAADDQAGAGQPADGGAAGGDQAGGAAGDQAGGGAAGDQAGSAGGGPGGSGETGLPGGDQSARLPGSGQLPPGVVPGHGTGLAGSSALPTLPTLPTPVTTAMTPLPPVTTTPLPPIPPMAALPMLPTGAGSGGGVGGIGGGSGGIGSAGKADLGKSAVGLGKVDQQISQAARMQPAAPPGTGQAPAMPTALTTGGNGASGAAGGGIPPMMPPMGAGAAAAGNAGRPGSGAIRPVGRERRRTNGTTPGVPEALQGRASKASFQPKPVRRDKEKATTLEVLDEDLWTVDASEPATAPQQVRRQAH